MAPGGVGLSTCCESDAELEVLQPPPPGMKPVCQPCALWYFIHYLVLHWLYYRGHYCQAVRYPDPN